MSIDEICHALNGVLVSDKIRAVIDEHPDMLPITRRLLNVAIASQESGDDAQFAKRLLRMLIQALGNTESNEPVPES